MNLIEVYEKEYSIVDDINQQKFSIFIVNQVLMLRKSFDATKLSINKKNSKKFSTNFSTRRRDRFKKKVKLKTRL